MSNLRNKVVLITGGARGIGAATARALADRGARLVLTDVDPEPLDASGAELGRDAALTVVADVTDLAAMQACVAAAVEKFGGIDVIVANAGIASYGSVLGVDPATFRRVTSPDPGGAPGGRTDVNWPPTYMTLPENVITRTVPFVCQDALGGKGFAASACP